MGWKSVKNPKAFGADAYFDSFITSDRALANQENLRGQRIAILELSTNKLRSIEAAAAQLRDAVEKITRTEFRRLPAVTQILRSKVEPRYAALAQTAIEKVIRAWRVRRGLVADVAIRDSRIAVP